MKIMNKSLANNSTVSSFGVHEFNSHGCTDMSEEAANALLSIPGFQRCAECQCEPALSEAKSEVKVPKAKKKQAESVESSEPESEN